MKDTLNKDTAAQIKSANSVSIHARVVDFKYGMLDAVRRKYFIKSVKHIKKNVKTPIFFVFSDNIEWCKDNVNTLGLSSEKKVIFVSHNSGEDSYRDMQLMSLCKHNIVPNSTFSWWGGYLNQNPNKIVCTPYATWPGTISF